MTAENGRENPGIPGLRKGPVLLVVACILTCILAALGLYYEVLDYALVGHDSYPIILTARIQSTGDFFGTFTEELMDGRYTQGHFYRPILNLSFALDHALFGLDSRGYHASDIVILGITAFLLALAAGRRGTPTGAGLVAAFLFLVHPVHLNVLPVPARRGDTLSLLFLLLALISVTRPGRLRWWGPALFTLLAVGAKEIALIGPALLFVRVLIGPEEGRGRWRRAFVLSLPPLGAVVLFALVRQMVLGGIGGHGEISVGAVIAHARLILPEFERITYYPYPVLASIVPGAAVRGGLLLFFAVASLALLRRSTSRGLGLFAWIWMLLGWAVHGLSQSISPWYVIHSVMPFTLLSGILIVEGVRILRTSHSIPIRTAAALCTAVFLSLGAVNLVNAPPFAFHPEWKDGTRKTNRYLADLKTRIDAAPGGSTIEAPGLPFMSRYRPGSPIVMVASLADYSVQAWSELVIPEREVRVAFPKPKPAEPGAHEVLVIVRVGP